MNRLVKICLLSAALTAVLPCSQGGAHAQRDQMDTWVIIMSSGVRLENCTLDSVEGSVLWIHQDSSRKAVALDSLATLRKPGKSFSYGGTIIGTIAGGVIGYLAAPGPRAETNTYTGPMLDIFTGTTSVQTVTETHVIPATPEVYAVLGATAGAAVGYLIGSGLGGEKVYDLRNSSSRVRGAAVRSIIRGVE